MTLRKHTKKPSHTLKRSLFLSLFFLKKKKPYIALASLYIASKPDNQCSVDKTLNKKKNHVYIRDIYQVAFDYYIYWIKRDGVLVFWEKKKIKIVVIKKICFSIFHSKNYFKNKFILYFYFLIKYFFILKY